MGGAASTPSNIYDAGHLSEAGKKLVNAAFANLDPKQILDIHAHVCGLGTNKSGCFVNKKMESMFWHPYHATKRMAFLGASGVGGTDPNADMKYLDILRELIEWQRPANAADNKQHGRCMLLPFDMYYDKKTGEPNPALTGFHVPNEWVQAAAAKYPESFVAAMSVHPYRKDAIQQLEKWHAAGSRVIKWLPNSMGIDPSDEKCIPYYTKCKELGLAILCHTGQEHSVDAGFLDNELGNPLHLRLPLDMGVTVIAAHCATEGDCCDTDPLKPAAPHDHKQLHDQKQAAPTAAAAAAKAKPKRADNFDLFLRLMDEKKYEGLLYGDISAITAFRRVQYLPRLLDRTDIHHRLIFGTDYPVPAVYVVVWTRKLVSAGLITTEERTIIDSIYKHNALLFDFVLKRTLKSPNGNKFTDCIFQTPPFLKALLNGGGDAKVAAKPSTGSAGSDQKAEAGSGGASAAAKASGSGSGSGDAKSADAKSDVSAAITQ